MPIPVWPASLPQRALVEGYGEGMGDGRMRSPMDAGPGKMRPRFRPTRPLTVAFEMTTAERDAMVAFVNDELAGGALPFRFPVQPLESGGTWLVRFADDLPSWSPVGTRWRVGLSLEIMP